MRVILFGYYGFGNAGDEAALAGLLHGLQQHGPQNAEYIILSGDPQQTESLHGVPAKPRNQWRTLLEESGRADVWIFGGGSLLQDVSGPLTLPFYLGVLNLLSLRQRPFFLHGHGVGPIRGRINRRLTGRLVRRAERISVRDVESARELIAIGVPEAQIALGADPAFLLPPMPQGGPRVQDEPLIGLALRPWRGSEAWFPQLLGGLQLFLSEIGGRLILVPMDAHADGEVAEKVQGRFTEVAIACDARATHVEKAELLARCDLVIAMRLHAGLLAALAGVPSVLLSYDPKVEALADLLNLSLLPVEDLTCTALQQMLHEAWQRRHATARELAIATTTLRMSAEEDLFDLVASLDKLACEGLRSG